jgi:superfamily II DNA helicase RecQ
VVGDWDREALARCRQSARDVQRARWSQYRAVWGYVEGDDCRRARLLAHFGDGSRPSRRESCCDVCAAGARDPGAAAKLRAA